MKYRVLKHHAIPPFWDYQEGQRQFCKFSLKDEQFVLLGEYQILSSLNNRRHYLESSEKGLVDQRRISDLNKNNAHNSKKGPVLNGINDAVLLILNHTNP